MWGQLTHDQRMRKLSTFLKTGIDDKNDPIQDPVKTANTDTSPPLTLKAEDGGITTIPMVILEAMFETETANLIATPGSVTPKPAPTCQEKLSR